MNHRRGCDLPVPYIEVKRRLLTGQWIALHRCPTCGAVAVHREDD